MTNGRGCDVVIEAVGIPASFELCQELVAFGGNIANIGVHGAPVQLKLEKLWGYNISEHPFCLINLFLADTCGSVDNGIHKRD